MLGRAGSSNSAVGFGKSDRCFASLLLDHLTMADYGITDSTVKTRVWYEVYNKYRRYVFSGDTDPTTLCFPEQMLTKSPAVCFLLSFVLFFFFIKKATANHSNTFDDSLYLGSHCTEHVLFVCSIGPCFLWRTWGLTPSLTQTKSRAHGIIAHLPMVYVSTHRLRRDIQIRSSTVRNWIQLTPMAFPVSERGKEEKRKRKCMHSGIQVLFISSWSGANQ